MKTIEEYQEERKKLIKLILLFLLLTSFLMVFIIYNEVLNSQKQNSEFTNFAIFGTGLKLFIDGEQKIHFVNDTERSFSWNARCSEIKEELLQ